MHTHIEEEEFSSNLSGETVEETNIVREIFFVETNEVRGKGSHVTMDPPGPPPIFLMPSISHSPPIGPLVRPRGLRIVVSQGLVAVDMPSHLPKFYGIKDEDPSRHMERFVEKVASPLITNQGYWLVGFLPPQKVKHMSGIEIMQRVILEHGINCRGSF